MFQAVLEYYFTIFTFSLSNLDSILNITGDVELSLLNLVKFNSRFETTQSQFMLLCSINDKCASSRTQSY